MNTLKIPGAELARTPPADWPDAVTEEWCRMHRLIDELTMVQRRLGTPFEESDDFLKVRGLGSVIREKLDQLSPWLQTSVEVDEEQPVA